MEHRIWYPTTQMKDLETWPPIQIERGKGIYLFDTEGNSYIDAISSWWVNLFGHANERIVGAVTEQLQLLEQVIFSGFTHRPAEELAERLIEIAPAGLSRVFFAGDGASAVEVALKMCFAFWKNADRPEKNRFVYLKNGYHGDTLGALSVCGDEFFTERFQEILQTHIQVDSPDCYRCPHGRESGDCDVECFESMERTVMERKDEIAGIIVEPLVLGAGGFKMYPPEYLTRLRKLADEADVLLVFDEIAVGFGRTGTMFAAEQAGIAPDLMCISKGITSGTMAMSATLATDRVYDAFYGEYTDLKGFMHSHSYSGNALACAAALETLNIFRDDDILNTNKAKYTYLQETVRDRFEGHPHVGDIRSCGWITAVELVKDPATKEPFDWKSRTAFQIYRESLKRGALLRNLDDIIYFMPPYVIEKGEIETLVDIAVDSVNEVLG